MVAKRALSTDFWSSTRSFAVSFFCRGGQYDTRKSVVTCTYLGLLALLEERVLTRLVGGLVLGEVAVLANLIQNLGVDTLQVNGGGGCDDIAGVDPSQRNAVYFEWASDEENTLGKVLEENDTLAAETTSEEDYDCSGDERGSGFRRACSLTGLESQLAVLRTVQFQPSALYLLCVFAAVASSTCIHDPYRPPLVVHRQGSALENIPSWGRRRPQPGSTCSPSGAFVPLC
jgi:hypothetical protein